MAALRSIGSLKATSCISSNVSVGRSSSFARRRDRAAQPKDRAMVWSRSSRGTDHAGPGWPVWLDPGSFKLHLPGGDAWVRVTTDAEVFDDHAESHEFLFPGGHVFETLAAPTPEGASASGAAAGHCWLVEAGGDGGACDMLVLIPEGARRVHSLGDLLERLDRLPDREGFDSPRHPEGSRVHRLA